MKEYLLSVLYGSIVGTAGTGLGGALSIAIKPKRENSALSSFLMGLSAGIMLAVVFVSMFPQSARLGSWKTLLLGAFAGAGFLLFINRLFKKRVREEHGNAFSQKSGLYRTGLLLFAGIAMHDFPEGIAVGAGLESNGGFGFAISLLMLLHNIPEGLAVAVPLKMGGMRAWKAILFAMLSGTPTIIGALVGTFFGSISPQFISSAIAFAGGAMLYLTVFELIPECLQIKHGWCVLAALVLGAAVGSILSILI